jgi:hypothetical protein
MDPIEFKKAKISNTNAKDKQITVNVTNYVSINKLKRNKANSNIYEHRTKDLKCNTNAKDKQITINVTNYVLINELK